MVLGGVAYLHDKARRQMPYCERDEPRQRVMAYLQGPLRPAEGKNLWHVAETRGDARPLGRGRLRLWQRTPAAEVAGGTAPNLGPVVAGQAYVSLYWGQQPLNTIVAPLPEVGWTRRSAGNGAKEPRWYVWRWLSLAASMDPSWRRGHPAIAKHDHDKRCGAEVEARPTASMNHPGPAMLANFSIFFRIFSLFLQDCRLCLTLYFRLCARVVPISRGV